MQNELELDLAPIDLEIQNLKNELKTIGLPADIQIDKLKNEQAFYKKEEEQLSIYAPTDGLIGNVHYREGENVSSFNTLISFYERNPTLVKGFVHENLILQVNVYT